MKAYKLIVLTNSVDGLDAEFNDWYSNRHLRDVVGVPGITCAQRFTRTSVFFGDQTWKYLAIYDLVSDDPEAVLTDLKSRIGTEKMPMSGALAPDLYGVLYEPTITLDSLAVPSPLD